ncbi:MAG: hypothetical protein ACI4HI_15545 [Lachnospiraceae bacterium]
MEKVRKITKQMILFERLRYEGYMGPEDYGIQLDISERTYFKYKKEMELCEKRAEELLEKNTIPIFEEHINDQPRTIYEKHLRQLTRLICLRKKMDELPRWFDTSGMIGVKEWRTMFWYESARTRQRDLQILREAGVKIYKGNGKYHFLPNEKNIIDRLEEEEWEKRKKQMNSV